MVDGKYNLPDWWTEEEKRDYVKRLESPERKAEIERLAKKVQLAAQSFEARTALHKLPSIDWTAFHTAPADSKTDTPNKAEKKLPPPEVNNCIRYVREQQRG